MTENYKLYLYVGLAAIIMIVASFFMESFTFEILTSKIFNFALFGGGLWLIRRWDFLGKEFSFQQAIKEGNIAAGITLAGIAIAVAITVSGIG